MEKKKKDKSIFAKRITKLREEQGWSMSEVANRLGMGTLSTYANWEYGAREPDFEVIKSIAELYQVSTDYLLGITNYKIRQEDISPEELRRNFEDTSLKFWLEELPEDELRVLKEMWRLIEGREK